MAAEREPRCWDAFPYAERQNRRLWLKGRELPGWYPELVQIFPMIICRVLPVAGMARPATYCRVLGNAAGGGTSAVWMGGYQASMLMDKTGWPVFRVERIFIPPETELPPGEILERLLADGQQIANGLGVRSFQVAMLEMADGSLPGFPVVGSPFGPMADPRLGSLLTDLGYSRLTDLGYYRAAAAGRGQMPAGRPYRWGHADISLYLQLWAEHCEQNRDDLLFLVSRLHPLDPYLQHHMDAEDNLARIRFIGGDEQPAGFVSWYPDVYPQLLGGEASGPQVRLQLGEVDPEAVTAAKVFKCLAPRAGEAGQEDLLAAGLRWAAGAAVAAHPRLEWVQAGPVARSHQALLSVLEREGFERFGSLVILEQQISRFKR